MDREPRTLPTVLGWTLVGLLGLLIVLETVALVVPALVISVPLAIAVPFLVAGTVVLIVRWARR